MCVSLDSRGLGLFCYLILHLIFTAVFPTLSLPLGGFGSNIHELITTVLQTGIQKCHMWLCGISISILVDKNYCVFSMTCWLEARVSGIISKYLKKHSWWLFDKALQFSVSCLFGWLVCFLVFCGFFFATHIPLLSAYHGSLLSQSLSKGILWCSGNYHFLVLASYRPNKWVFNWFFEAFLSLGLFFPAFWNVQEFK